MPFFWFGVVTAFTLESVVMKAAGVQAWHAWERAQGLVLPFGYSLLIHGLIWGLVTALVTIAARFQALAEDIIGEGTATVD